MTHCVTTFRSDHLLDSRVRAFDPDRLDIVILGGGREVGVAEGSDAVPISSGAKSTGSATAQSRNG